MLCKLGCRYLGKALGSRTIQVDYSEIYTSEKKKLYGVPFGQSHFTIATSDGYLKFIPITKFLRKNKKILPENLACFSFQTTEDHEFAEKIRNTHLSHTLFLNQNKLKDLMLLGTRNEMKFQHHFDCGPDVDVSFMLKINHHNINMVKMQYEESSSDLLIPKFEFSTHFEFGYVPLLHEYINFQFMANNKSRGRPLRQSEANYIRQQHCVFFDNIQTLIYECIIQSNPPTTTRK